jgi:uncharacterized repeat protein (TIGR02543 family)
MDITAQYEEACGVTFHIDETESVTVAVKNGEKVEELDNPEKTGYTFDGWFRDADCTTEWNFDSDVVTVNTDLYAKWNRNSYTVTFQDYDGAVISTQSALYGDAVETADPTREGYDFIGWGADLSNITSDLTVTAQYELTVYTVTFEDWDGTPLKTQTVTPGAMAIAPTDPTREGYNFTGWNTDFTNVTSNLTVTATYSIKTYTVTFKNWNGDTLKTDTISHGGIATAPANPPRSGYDFIGWDVDFSNVTSDLTITAQYNAKGRDIVQGFDTYQFVNATSHFFSGDRGTYKITGDYYDYLLTAPNSDGGVYVNGVLSTWRQLLIDNMNAKWGGSCFGMAAVLSLTKADRLTPGFFQYGAN